MTPRPRRWRHLAARVLVGVVGVLLIAAAAGATFQSLVTARDLSTTPPPGRLVDVGGYRLHIWCTGEGVPAVVLDSGLGGTAFDWGLVQPDLSRTTRVCSYDRAGLGYSDAGPTPRTSRQIARELSTLLTHARVDGPLVLAGASFGGFNVRLFTAMYPQRVAGLILVDASHEDQGRRFAKAGVPSGDLPFKAAIPFIAAIAPPLGLTRLLAMGAGTPEDALAPEVRRFAKATRFRSSAFRAAAGEYLGVEESATQLRESRRQWDIPLIVLSRTRARDELSGRIWQEMQVDQALLSRRGCRIPIPGSGHLIASDQPGSVVEAIVNVVQAVRGTRPLACPVSAVTAAQTPW